MVNCIPFIWCNFTLLLFPTIEHFSIKMILKMNLGKTMKDQIEQTVQAIIGMPMWSIGRAANLEWGSIWK